VVPGRPVRAAQAVEDADLETSVAERAGEVQRPPQVVDRFPLLSDASVDVAEVGQEVSDETDVLELLGDLEASADRLRGPVVPAGEACRSPRLFSVTPSLWRWPLSRATVSACS
jgi:hypothetical protein